MSRKSIEAVRAELKQVLRNRLKNGKKMPHETAQIGIDRYVDRMFERHARDWHSVISNELTK